ncbi:MAG: hypothetical protein GY927_08625, partial [bacterium]|nr:hypothetical protein [bacterium]
KMEPITLKRRRFQPTADHSTLLVGDRMAVAQESEQVEQLQPAPEWRGRVGLVVAQYSIEGYSTYMV